MRRELDEARALCASSAAAVFEAYRRGDIKPATAEAQQILQQLGAIVEFIQFLGLERLSEMKAEHEAAAKDILLPLQPPRLHQCLPVLQGKKGAAS